MKYKLFAALAVSAVVLGGAGYGTHYVITGNIEDAIAKIKSQSPGTEITYSRYSVDPFGMELSLHDVTIKAPETTAGLDLTVHADRLIYSECDFEHEVPRHCVGGFEGLTISSPSPEVGEMLKKIEEEVGQPLRLDMSSRQHYVPEAKHRFTVDATISWPNVGKTSLALGASGVDMEALTKRVQEIQASLASLPEEERALAFMGIANEWQGLEIEKMEIAADSELLLTKLANLLNKGAADGAELDGAARLAKLDELAAQLGGTSPRLTALVTNAEFRAFVEAPKSLTLAIQPDKPLNVTALAMQLAAASDLAALKLSAKVNERALPIADILAAH